jgi:hypothetical protein
MRKRCRNEREPNQSKSMLGSKKGDPWNILQEAITPLRRSAGHSIQLTLGQKVYVSIKLKEAPGQADEEVTETQKSSNWDGV